MYYSELQTFPQPSSLPPTHSLLLFAVMPASEVINDWGFEGLSWVCVGVSLCGLEMFGVKARLSSAQKNYGCVKCEFVIEMIKGSPKGIVYHTLQKNRVVVVEILDLSNKKECQHRFIRLSFHLVVEGYFGRATALTSKCTQSERFQAVTDHGAAPLAEIRPAEIEKLRSMSHYGECRLLSASAARAGYSQLWLSSSAARQSLSRFPPTCSEAVLPRNPSRIFSGLTLDSMSNILSRNNEAGHHPSRLTLFKLSEQSVG